MHNLPIFHSHRIHGTGIFTYLHLPYKSSIHEGKYTSPMDPIGFYGVATPKPWVKWSNFGKFFFENMGVNKTTRRLEEINIWRFGQLECLSKWFLSAKLPTKELTTHTVNGQPLRFSGITYIYTYITQMTLVLMFWWKRALFWRLHFRRSVVVCHFP